MSIESKHAYRFGYLKSEQWKNVRIEALAREKGMCQICREESISNDAHHVWYPENIYETTERHLVVLCRPCHEFIHTMLPECKTRDEEEGIENWNRFKNSIIAWRISKVRIFQNVDDIPVKAASLRAAYDVLKRTCKAQQDAIESLRTTGMCSDTLINAAPPASKPKSFQSQLDDMLKNIRRWAMAFHSSDKQSLDMTDYSI